MNAMNVTSAMNAMNAMSAMSAMSEMNATSAMSARTATGAAGRSLLFIYSSTGTRMVFTYLLYHHSYLPAFTPTDPKNRRLQNGSS